MRIGRSGSALSEASCWEKGKPALPQAARALLQTAALLLLPRHTVIQPDDLARMPAAHCSQPPDTRIPSKMNLRAQPLSYLVLRTQSGLMRLRSPGFPG